MTCAEADRIRREGPGLTVERMDGVARVILTCSVDHADIIKARWEQLRCARQLAEGHPEQAGLRLGASDNLMEELEIVYGLFTSFGEAESQAPEPDASAGGSDAARAPNDGGKMKAPFPWFGGKSKVAELVWDRFGDVPNYVEPFFGSGAVLLNRPHAAGTETVNDLDCMVANFWRALKNAPDAVAFHADNPVNEADQHARHLWLCSQEEFRERMKVDPDFYDTKIAGWWVWGQCIWIGSGWCSVQLPHLGDAGKGVHRKLPHLGDAGKGLNRQRPHLGNAGRGVEDCLRDRTSGTRRGLREYMHQLADRLRQVRVCSGDWQRICGPSVTFKHGVTGVFLDPPYADSADRDATLYAAESLNVAHDVRRWAIENGDNPLLRIALCGYEGEHEMPDSWECIAWKARGGYGSQGDGRGRDNAGRERIWFSPACLRPMSLFGGDF